MKRRSLLFLALGALAACAPREGAELEPWDAVEPVPPAPPLLVTHAAAHHTCALDAGGAATCWGRNDEGQLGAGHTQPMRVPVRPAGDHRFEMIVVGGHTCALDTEGIAHCWGSNHHGQLGDGHRADRAKPLPVATERRFARLAAGAAHTCALDDVGRAFCWGDNRWGQLGDGTRTSSSVPVAVIGEEAFSRLSAGSRHTCGITGEEAVLCWGDNFLGQLGQPRSIVGSLHPVPVPILHGMVQLDAGHGHTCAITREGSGWCWGQNGIGQLGSGAPPGMLGPVEVAGVPPLVELRVGYHHTCAIDVARVGWCWGANSSAEPGDASISGQLGSDASWSNLPLALPLDEPLDLVAPGDAHTCVLTLAGEILCFGFNRFGQLGRPLPDRSIDPVRVIRVQPAPRPPGSSSLAPSLLPFPQH